MAEWYKLKQTAYCKWFYRFHLLTGLVWWSDIWLPLPPNLVFIGLWSLWCYLSLITLTRVALQVEPILGGFDRIKEPQGSGSCQTATLPTVPSGGTNCSHAGEFGVPWARSCKSSMAEWAGSKWGAGRAALSSDLVWEGAINGGGICHLDNLYSPTCLFKHFQRKLVKLSDVKSVFQLRGEYEGEKCVLFVLRGCSQEYGCKSLPQILQTLSTHTVVTWSWLPKLAVSKLL